MSESHAYGTKQIDLELDNPLKISRSRIKQMEDFFNLELNDREKMRKKLDKYMTALDQADYTLIVLAGASSGASLCSFTTVIGTPAVLRVLVLIYCFVSLNKLVKCF